jgi:hypothetical protein
MHTWGEFRDARPDLAEAGRALLYQFGVGLGFLGTVRTDGGPRVHPMCPIILGRGLYALIVPSPKAWDLVRDGRYALHSFPPEDDEDAFYLSGRVLVRDGEADAARRAEIDALFLTERKLADAPPGFDQQTLVEFLIETCLLTRTTGHGDDDPQHTVWHADV